MEILGYRQYYDEAVEILEEIAKVFDANVEVRCQSERQRLLEIVKYAKSQSDYNHRAWEGFRKDAEHFRDEAKAYEAKWRAVLEKYEDIRDTDWYTKIKGQEKQIDCQKDTISRLEEENKQLQDVINHLKPVSDAAEVIGLKIENNCLKSKLNKIEKVLKGEM